MLKGDTLQMLSDTHAPVPRTSENMASASARDDGWVERHRSSHLMSSRAVLMPNPKKGFTVWMASPRSTVLARRCTTGPQYWKAGSRCSRLAAKAAKASSSMKSMN